MINFRTADIIYEGDAMAALLRETFNQSIFTRDYLVWKHVENPAGKSFVLIAEENSKMVGLRIFMLWDFHIHGKSYKALRPVDTAVHKDYQGKGLFKQLTLQGLEMMKGNFDFIFNTPNANSLPGYLKMGWTKINNKASFYFTPTIPFPRATNFANDRKLKSQGDVEEFIKWRYSPARYKWAIFGDQSIVIYRLEKRRAIRFIIIVDSFFTKGNLKRSIQSICSKEKAVGFYFLYNRKTENLKSFLSVKRGTPVIVSKGANGMLDEYDFALGDVEGIL
jgi:GNAT superfamily N-acetyltransferase